MSELKENKIRVDNPIFDHLTTCLHECMKLIEEMSEKELEELKGGLFTATKDQKEYVLYLTLRRLSEVEYNEMIEGKGNVGKETNV